MAVIKLSSYDLPCGCQYNGTTNSYNLCDKDAKTIKIGEERSRWGQRNTQIGSQPTPKRREIYPREPNSRKVWDWLQEIRNHMVSLMMDLDEWHRITSIEVLVKDQLKDEAGYTWERIGRSSVEPREDWDPDDDEALWPDLSSQQKALVEGMETFLEKVTDVQLETIRFRFHQNLSLRDTAHQLGVSRQSVEVNERRALKSLRRLFTEEWGEEDPLDQAVG